jgi:hypothetical protein
MVLVVCCCLGSNLACLFFILFLPPRMRGRENTCMEFLAFSGRLVASLPFLSSSVLGITSMSRYGICTPPIELVARWPALSVSAHSPPRKKCHG